VAGACLVLLAVTACAEPATVRFDSRAVSSGNRQNAVPGLTGLPAGKRHVGGLLPAPAATSSKGPSLVSAGGAPVAVPSSAASKGVIKLGTVLPLEGGDRDWGVPVLRTTQAYIDELNARGGVAGYRLQLVAYNACLTCQDDALTAVRHLVEQDHVFAIVNTYVMVVAFQSVIPYLQQRGVPLIQGGSEAQDNDALSPINFVTAPPGLFSVHFLAAMVAKYSHLKKVAIAYLDVPTERHGLPLVEHELQKEGVQVVDTASIAAEEQAATNMDGIVTRFRYRGAQGVLATNPVLVVFGRLAAARQGWQVPWIGEAAWSFLVPQTCGTTCDNVVLTETAGLSFTTRDTPQMKQFIDVMRRRYPGGSVTGHTLAAWVGMQLLAQILGEVGKPDRAAFIDTLNHTTNLDLGTTSPLTFTPSRHMGGTATTLLRLRNGQYVAVSGPVTG
jgi:ABC-type branched-subunit amino acid transport system substrate-binding protein